MHLHSILNFKEEYLSYLKAWDFCLKKTSKLFTKINKLQTCCFVFYAYMLKYIVRRGIHNEKRMNKKIYIML